MCIHWQLMYNSRRFYKDATCTQQVLCKWNPLLLFIYMHLGIDSSIKRADTHAHTCTHARTDIHEHTRKHTHTHAHTTVKCVLMPWTTKLLHKSTKDMLYVTHLRHVVIKRNVDVTFAVPHTIYFLLKQQQWWGVYFLLGWQLMMWNATRCIH